MYELENRLKAIRGRLERDGYQIPWKPDAFFDRPLPNHDANAAYRIERALNMQPESHVVVDPSGFIKEFNRTLFRLKYRELYKAVSIVFVKIGDRFAHWRDWAYDKSIKWGRI